MASKKEWRASTTDPHPLFEGCPPGIYWRDFGWRIDIPKAGADAPRIVRKDGTENEE